MNRAYERHIRYYYRLAQQHPTDWRQIQGELPQIRRAWDWLIQQTDKQQWIFAYIAVLVQFLERQGLWKEEIAWVEHGLTATREQGEAQLEGTFLNTLGSCYAALGQRDVAMKWYQQALAQRHQTQDRMGEGTTLNNIAGLLYQQRDFEQALPYYEQALQILPILLHFLRIFRR